MQEYSSVSHLSNGFVTFKCKLNAGERSYIQKLFSRLNALEA